MSSTDIVGYTYAVEIRCPGCTATAVGWSGDGDPDDYIEQQGRDKGFVREDTYDSSDWPKVIFESQADSDETCASCGGLL